MSKFEDMENKLERFRKFVEISDRKTGEAAPVVEEKPSKPAASEPQPVAARIGPQLADATGSVSQVDRTSVLASAPARPETATPPASFRSEPLPAAEEEIPEVEDYMPWLKDEGTGEPKKIEESVQSIVEEEPVQPVVEERTSPVVEEDAVPEVEEKPAPTVNFSAPPAAPAAPVTPSSTAASPVTPSTPAPSSTPREYVPPTKLPSRDQILPFEGTGDPRPILREDDDDLFSEPKPAAPVEASAPVETGVEEPGLFEDEVTAVAPVIVSEPAPAPKPVKTAKQTSARVMLKQPSAPPQIASGEDVALMWGRLPRHIQLLMGTQPKEVAQHSYKRFKETRDEMIQRLLDPSLSLEEAARVLNVCPTTVRRYTNRGVLPHFRTAGNQRRFRLSDVLAFLETQSSARLAEEEAEEVLT